MEIQREVAHYALPLQGIVHLKVPKFQTATALQHCFKSSSSLRRPADFSPPYRFNCLWTSSFHFQFHDLRLVLERGDFGGG